MPATVTVLYPARDDATFNMDYYMSTHMPLVTKKWESFGLQGWKINKFVGTATGSPPPYTVSATLHWPSVDAFQQAAAAPVAHDVMGDIPNFTNTEPIILISDVVGTNGSQA